MRAIFIIIGVIASFFSLLVLVGIGQVEKNRKVAADLADRADAVRKFVAQTQRLPTETELEGLSASLPTRYPPRYHYSLNASIPEAPRSPNGTLDTTNWVLSFWRGEWSDYYCSWNGYSSVGAQTSILGFCGPFIVAPLVAVGSFYAAHRRKHSPTPPP